MSLDNLERDLYSRSNSSRKKVSKKKKVKDDDVEKKFRALDLGDYKEKKIKIPEVSSWKKWLGFAVTAIFVLSVLVGSFYLWKSFNSSGVNVNIQTLEETIKIGVPFKVDLSIANDTGREVQNARLSINLPDNLVLVDGESSQRIINKDVGDVGVGVVVRETLELVAVSGEQTIQDIEATLFYESGTIASTYESYGRISIVLEDPVIKLDIETPKKVFSGERFDTIINYSNETDIEVEDVEIEFLYPDSFEVMSVLSESDVDEPVWNFDKVSSGDKGELTVVGSVVGPADSFFDLTVKVSAILRGKRYVILEKTASLSIEASPLSLSVHLNDEDDYVAKPGDTLNYTLVYENNTSIGLKDVIIKARLNGDMFDYSSLKSTGFFNFSERQISWNASSKSDLSLIKPGESGTVSFTIGVLNGYPITRLNDKNFNLLVESSIESPTVPDNVAANTTTSIADLTTKVAGDVEVDVKVLFRDAESGFVNSGKLPPKVDEPVQFTVHMLVKNYSTDVSGVKLTSSLAPGVKWTGNVKSTVASSPSFNERTGDIEWNIGSIIATKGVISNPIEAIFQVEVIPSLTNVGSEVLIIRETSITATDDFTSVKLSDKHGGINSSLPDDPTVTGQSGRVIE